MGVHRRALWGAQEESTVKHCGVLASLYPNLQQLYRVHCEGLASTIP